MLSTYSVLNAILMSPLWLNMKDFPSCHCHAVLQGPDNTEAMGHTLRSLEATGCVPNQSDNMSLKVNVCFLCICVCVCVSMNESEQHSGRCWLDSLQWYILKFDWSGPSIHMHLIMLEELSRHCSACQGTADARGGKECISVSTENFHKPLCCWCRGETDRASCSLHKRGGGVGGSHGWRAWRLNSGQTETSGAQTFTHHY